MKEILEFGEDGQGSYKVFSFKLPRQKEHSYMINRYADDGELLESFILSDGDVFDDEDEDR